MKKCVFCDGSHDVDDCRFYTEIPVEERSKFLKENKPCYGCYEEISSQHRARSCKNRRRYAKRNTMQVTFKFKNNFDLDLKKRANQAMMVLMLMMQLLKVTVQVLIEQQPSLVK